MNLELYSGRLIVKSFGALSGWTVKAVTASELRGKNVPVINAFLEDDELQQMTVSSGNRGVHREYSKVHASRNHEIEDAIAGIAAEWSDGWCD